MLRQLTTREQDWLIQVIIWLVLAVWGLRGLYAQDERLAEQTQDNRDIIIDMKPQVEQINLINQRLAYIEAHMTEEKLRNKDRDELMGELNVLLNRLDERLSNE